MPSSSPESLVIRAHTLFTNRRVLERALSLAAIDRFALKLNPASGGQKELGERWIEKALLTEARGLEEAKHKTQLVLFH